MRRLLRQRQVRGLQRRPLPAREDVHVVQWGARDVPERGQCSTCDDAHFMTVTGEFKWRHDCGCTGDTSSATGCTVCEDGFFLRDKVSRVRRLVCELRGVRGV